MERTVGLLHLCRKAGKLRIGQKAVLSSLNEDNRPLILLASDVGSSLKRKLAAFETITVNWSAEKMGGVFDREKVSVLGIADGDFAVEIRKILESERNPVI